MQWNKKNGWHEMVRNEINQKISYLYKLNQTR